MVCWTMWQPCWDVRAVICTWWLPTRVSSWDACSLRKMGVSLEEARSESVYIVWDTGLGANDPPLHAFRRLHWRDQDGYVSMEYRVEWNARGNSENWLILSFSFLFSWQVLVARRFRLLLTRLKTLRVMPNSSCSSKRKLPTCVSPKIAFIIAIPALSLLPSTSKSTAAGI